MGQTGHFSRHAIIWGPPLSYGVYTGVFTHTGGGRGKCPVCPICGFWARRGG